MNCNVLQKYLKYAIVFVLAFFSKMTEKRREHHLKLEQDREEKKVG